MRKIFSIFLILSLVLAVSACGTDQDKDSAECNEPAAVESAGQEGGSIETAEADGPVVLGKYEADSEVGLDSSWEFAGNSKINSGKAVLYKAENKRKDITIAVNAGHGTEGGSSVKTLCHPDGSAKTTGGSTAAGATEATAAAGGMEFNDGTAEREVTLAEAQILKELLLDSGYDVLMIRDGEDVQLDNIARTVISNNMADCHIAIHWDSDGMNYDKGAFAIGVPESIRSMYPVSETWQEDENLGDCLERGLESKGIALYEGRMAIDLTQTSYSTIPTVDIELGNQCSDHSTEALEKLARGLLAGIKLYYGN